MDPGRWFRLGVVIALLALGVDAVARPGMGRADAGNIALAVGGAALLAHAVLDILSV